jgi:polar amino acid transport system substrate-binding protein
VVATSDPAVKLRDAQILYAEQQRPLIAERLIREAIQIYEERGDTLGLGHAYRSYGKADVISLGKPGLFAIAAKQAGSRVLDGRILAEQVGMGVPKGRNAAAEYVGKFVEEAKAEGLVKSAIERAGLRGVVVAPLK